MGIVVLGAVFIDIKGHSTSSYIPAGRNVGTVEEVHGGVSRNVVEDIANVELRPKFVSLVDESGIGTGVLEKLNNHKVDTRFVRRTPDGMGKWLAVFDNHGDVVASISKRPDLSAINDILDEQGDDIFGDADSIALEIDMEKDTIKRVFKYAEKYNLKVYAAVSNMSIAVERRDFLKNVECFVCNQQEAGILFMDDYSQKTPEEMQEILAKKMSELGFENYILQISPYYVRNSKGSIEVKSGKDYKRHNAIRNVLADENYPINEAIVLSNENVERVGKITYAPVYMAMLVAPDSIPEKLVYKI